MRGPGSLSASLVAAVLAIAGSGCSSCGSPDPDKDKDKDKETPAVAARFAIAADAEAVAGSTITLTISALDEDDEVVETHTGAVVVTATDEAAELPDDGAFVAEGKGTLTLTVVLKTAGSQTISVRDAEKSELVGAVDVEVSPAAAETLDLVLSGETFVAGEQEAVTVTAFDPFGNRATTYAGTLSFTSSDAAAELPDDVTFTSEDAGSRVISGFAFKTAGDHSLDVIDTGVAALTDTAALTVVPAPAASLELAGLEAEVTAAAPQTIHVTVRDAFANVVTGYTGTIAFTSDDPAATLPEPVTFAAADEGERDVSGIAFATAGEHALTATDATDSSVTGTASTTVAPGAAHAFEISGVPDEVFHDDPLTVILTVRDVAGNVATGYVGTVAFSSTDDAATLPESVEFTGDDAGVREVSGLSFATGGEQTFTATDSGDASVTGSVTTLVIPDVEWKAGTPEEPHVIHTVDGLQAMNQKLDEHYVLGRDIDASATRTWNPSTRKGPVWTRIVGYDVDFQNIVAGNALILSHQKRLIALEAATGTPLWETLLPLPDDDDQPLVSGFAAGEGRLFVGTNSGLVLGLDANTGAVLWDFDAEARVYSVLEHFDGRLYFTTYDDELFVLDAATGGLVWKKAIVDEANTLLVAGDLVYLAANQSVLALQVDTGDEEWSFETGELLVSDFVLHEGVLYFGSDQLYGRDAATGVEVVTTPLDNDVVTNFLLDGDTIYFAVWGRPVSAYDIVEKTFTVAANTLTQSRLFLSNGLLLVTAVDGELWAVPTSGDDAGTEVWTHESLAYSESGRKRLHGDLLLFASGGLVQALDTTNAEHPVFLGFEPVGNNGPAGEMVAEEENEEFAFRGGFDGAGHTISGLYIDRPDTNFVGLFGFARDATIANVRLTDARISGARTTGVLVGDLWGGAVTNAHAGGAVSGVEIVGGLLGGSTNGAITSSSASTRVYGRGSGIGGLVGGLDGTASVSASFSTGTVRAAKDDSGSREGVGGLVGGSGGAITIRDSYARGDVVGGSITGGLYGASESGTPTIERCYATGNVFAKEVAGGLVGGTSDSSNLTLSDSFAAGSVLGGFILGGVVGGALSEITLEANLRWLSQDLETEVCMAIPSASEEVCEPVDASTQSDYFFHVDNAPMNASGDGWDFDGVWSRSQDGTGFPVLKWQE